jgi:hypothetical protein
MDTCLKVIPVNHHFDQEDHDWVVLTSIEIWNDRIVVHSVRNRVQIDGPPQPLDTASARLHAFGWDISDDVGTDYEPAGGSGGVGGMPNDPMVWTLVASPAPPGDATVLRLFVNRALADRPLEVPIV